MAAAGKTEESSEVAGQKNQSRPSNLCCYSQRTCNLEKLKGFDFCHKHILEDKASPFKPCDFYAKSNDRRCMNPAPKIHDKEKSYCIIHTRKAELRRAVEKRRKKRRRDSSPVEEDEEESILEKRKRTSSTASQKSVDGSQKDEEGHSSDDDLGMELGIGGSLKVDSAWHGDVDSDAESVDSEEEDILRHAGVWTLDEASKVCFEKMVRLKSLYVAQYKRLFHVLKEKRRKYLQVIQAEHESESGESHLNPSEILRSPSHHKRHGVEAILHKQAKEKRHGGTTRHQSMSHQRCTHVADTVRCPNRILPLTKYCIHHISHDPYQLLFQSCSFKIGDQKTCTNMIPKIYPFSACQLHTTLPAEPTRTDVKKDLEGAKKRDAEKRASENHSKNKAVGSVVVDAIPPIPQVINKPLPIPKALQQKSSALIPPLPPTTMETYNAPETLPTIKVSPVTAIETKPSALKIEKMEVDPSGLEGLLPRDKASSDSTPMEVLSPASGDSQAGVQNISPTLLAASLAAVCSETPGIAVMSPLATASPPNSTTLSTPSSDSITIPVSTASTAGACVASSTVTSSVSTSTSSSTPTDLPIPTSSAASGLITVTSSQTAAGTDSVISSSSSSLSTKGDLPLSTTDTSDVVSKNESVTEKSIISTKEPSVSESKASTTGITTTVPNTQASSSTTANTRSMSQDSKARENTNITPITSESDSSSLKMDTELVVKKATANESESVSTADGNPTTAAPAKDVSTPAPDSQAIPGPTDKDSSTVVTSETEKLSNDK